MHERREEEPTAEALFFPPPWAKSRIKQPRRGSLQALFFARGFLPPPPRHSGLCYVPVPAQNGRHRHGVLPCEAPRDSPWKFSVFLLVTSMMQPICKRRTWVECASTKREIGKEIFVENTQLREESSPSNKQTQEITMASFHVFHGFAILKRTTQRRVVSLFLSRLIPSCIKLGFAKFCKIA